MEMPLAVTSLILTVNSPAWTFEGNFLVRSAFRSPVKSFHRKRNFT